MNPAKFEVLQKRLCNKVAALQVGLVQVLGLDPAAADRIIREELEKLLMRGTHEQRQRDCTGDSTGIDIDS